MTFDETKEIPSQTQRIIDGVSQWSSMIKPFLLDNVGWFVGAFLVISGFVVLIVTFWNTIEQNQILMHSLVYASLFAATSLFFTAGYFMRLKYPRLESSSDVLLIIVALLIPLVFAAAVMTALIPNGSATEASTVIPTLKAFVAAGREPSGLSRVYPTNTGRLAPLRYKKNSDHGEL